MIDFCVICNANTKQKKKFEYFQKPKVEKKYNLFKNKKYYRYYSECNDCSHWNSNFKFNTNKFYEGNYNNKSYNDHKSTFLKILNLKKEDSDNYYRSNRIKNFLNMKKGYKSKILDVGSGLGIFPYSMIKKGFNCDALDPDLVMVNHMKKVFKRNKGIYCGNFFKIKIKKKYDLLTLNKVLEHVENPIKFLLKAKNLLKDKGYIYLELPDIEEAMKRGKNREEFTIEHIQGFNLSSVIKMLNKIKMRLVSFERIREPSGKYTFFCFINKL